MGGSLPINFAPPQETPVLARIVGGSFNVRADGPNRYAMAMDLEEVL
jgi:hypothetical protein